MILRVFKMNDNGKIEDLLPHDDLIIPKFRSFEKGMKHFYGMDKRNFFSKTSLSNSVQRIFLTFISNCAYTEIAHEGSQCFSFIQTTIAVLILGEDPA